MKTFFEVIPDSFYEEDCSLICEISSEGVSFCIKNNVEHKYIGVAVYNFDKSRPQSGFHIALQIIFNTKPFLSRNYRKVVVVYSLPESVLIPFGLFDSRTAGDSLKLLFGNLHPDPAELTDLVTEQGYYNSYRIRNDIYKVIDAQYPERTDWHKYSSLLGSHSTEENKMYVIFYSYKMIVSLFVEGKCLLINSYDYQYAEDVSYYLLSIREENNIDNIALEVSGFIEKNSTLYNELYKYFKDISFARLSPLCEYSEDILHYPSHYFCHLFDLDPCG